MYKEKLISQMELMERLQSGSTMIDVTDAIRISERILSLAKKIDNLEQPEQEEAIIRTNINGDVVYETVKN